MDFSRFEELVAQAVAELPAEFRDRLDNVDIVVQDRPSARQLRQVRAGRGYTLFGLYEGIPNTRRGSHYGMVPPDVITIFKEPIESVCHSDAEVIREIGKVVRHEIAHHFGIGDARLSQLERERDDL
jgi:predicted Zn-dependent protease with MMP-like domain